MRAAIAAMSAALAVLLLSATPAGGSYQLVAEWGKYGTGEGRFFQPAGVAIDQRGNVYVADAGNARIQKFDSSGTFIDEWGGHGRFDLPWGIATDSQGDLYVADPLADRVQKFDSSGELIAGWGRRGSGDGEFNGPTGVATDSEDNVYVVEASACARPDCPPANDRVQKFDSGGEFIGRWGSSGSGSGQFDSPYGVATDSEDNVYVADTGNARIQKFDSSGAFITRWGEWGWAGDGEFTYPWALEADSFGNVFVADWGCPRIQRFDPSGRFIDKWGAMGSGDGQFQRPYGVASDSGGRVYVADTGNHRIQVFADLNETTITAGPFEATLDNTPTFSFFADRQGCTFECRLDLEPFVACVSPFTAATLADGPHRFRVRAIDREGAIDPTPAGRDFNVVAGVDAQATARRFQRQAGNRITLKARVTAKERLTARARGKVRVAGTYRLRRGKAEIAEGRSKAIRLVPRRREEGRRIVAALSRGERVKARLKVKLTDQAGNTRTEKLQVRLKR
jgi:DNA-binding beta-propeller fold protein YncE